MEAPSAIKRHINQALIDKESVLDVIFSEGTYQVHVQDSKDQETYWPFLQFDEEGKLVDFFCSCSESEKENGCPHLAAAFLHITKPELIHIRFKRSFWYALFHRIAEKAGYQTTVLKKAEGKYSYFEENVATFFLQPTTEKGKKRLKEMVEERVKETEETSLKFSNLSIEEMQEYKEGRASLSLRFELSFWSDIAKWLFLAQDANQPYTVDFPDSLETLPKGVFITFPHVKIYKKLSQEDWPHLIEPLKTINASIPVENNAFQGLKSIVYDETLQSFFLKKSSTNSRDSSSTKTKISLGSWFFSPGKGFYKEGKLSTKNEIQKQDIDEFISLHKTLLDRYLQNACIHEEKKPLLYSLTMDLKKGLLIQAYLFSKGDLQENGAVLFSSFAYLPKKGFFPIEKGPFKETLTIVPIEEMGEFITKYRSFLHQYEGFQTHFGSLEAELNYHLDEEETLVFSSKLSSQEGSLLDLGEWIYIESEGFYRKKGGKEVFILKPGLRIKKEEIAPFLDRYKDELMDIRGFFLPESPILESGLEIKLNELERISVTPKRVYALGIDEKLLVFFGSYIYLQDKGFFFLEPRFSLPEPFSKPCVIPQKKEGFFLQYEIERLKPFSSYIDPRLKKPQHLRLKVRKLLKERKNRKDYWVIDLFYESNLGIREMVDVWRCFLDKKKVDYSPAGLIFLEEPRFSWLKTLGKRRLQKKSGLLRLTTVEWIRLCIMENLEEPEGNSPEAEISKKWMRQLDSFEASRLIDIADLKSTLRPYQELGLQWLWFLYCHGLAGLLCDEMGLGKTHQAMAILAASLKEQNYKAKYLVVCPTSVIYHWQDLLNRFLPKVRTLTYYGLERTLEKFAQDYDVLLTSYGILRTGKENLNPYRFELAIFDEIQIAKNHTSQTHAALLNISANMKLGLTGTPIENRLRELKAIFDIVLPGYLPEEKSFRELFVNPIEKHHNPEQKALLQKLVKPFILRRKKAEVLLDLPEKIEEISYLDLSTEQKRLYKEVTKDQAQKILTDLEKTNTVPYVHIFSLLSKLKQICDHPSLFYGDIKSYENYESGKWEFFKELIDEARASKQKVVVFSQYLGMLSIIENYLKKQKIGFTSIKGSTKNRKEPLERFRNDPKCEVFVASLLAAGVGIDLSSASIVIHYDRWWNPAKEDQATDRVHRIGQNRGVQVFKLVSKNTIEEHIHQMIDSKKNLIESSIGKDDSDQIRLLSRKELMEVLKKTTEM